VQGHRAVGQVDGLAAPAHLAVDGAAGRDDRAEVGDRVVDPEPVAAAGDAQRLVEVLGARRVDGDQLDVGGVDSASTAAGKPVGSANSARTAAKSGTVPEPDVRAMAAA
jgi:hypothetical protein